MPPETEKESGSHATGSPRGRLTAGARVSNQLICPCTRYELTSEEGLTASDTNR
jgi:hypothetical protein